ncbi:terpenoid cyclases/protein prenyltransferase alpha-alpha toroid [Vararia minispora EC-137]|uniref:Terpenoid cyclases/protein prenyltransferase alpha-alpha toroid n=1 Tax=Vararia minispora EC-137 TaxID=1314806 RepID=A0ACB8QTQ9_9AGAM|nr:terpenoid cyclases/protein prenyltransferase alpha-alpha toroid [Vararia minispora EC-137]
MATDPEPFTLPEDVSAQPVPIPPLERSRHVAHCNRCLAGLPASLTDIDSSRMVLAFYCLGVMDVYSALDMKLSASDREAWRGWIWAQQAGGEHGTGFRPGPFMTRVRQPGYTDASAPHLIMTYCALLSLAILRDDFRRLDRAGLVRFVRACQDTNGGFTTTPGADDADLRMCYCAFVVCSFLNDWSGMDVTRAVDYIRRCRTYEGGYGQSPGAEALGGTTYCAIAALYLLPQDTAPAGRLTRAEHRQTVRWLVHTQDGATGGFAGRTNKVPDACYCFWQGAALAIMGEKERIDAVALTRFFARCQHRFGGIAKAQDEAADPYHTYLASAMIAIAQGAGTWALGPLDPLVNATEETAAWARERVPARPVLA